MASDYYEKFIEEIKRRNPESFPEDKDLILPDTVKDQFDSRFSQPSDIQMSDFRSDDDNIPGLPDTTIPTPDPSDLDPANLPEPIVQAPSTPESSSFDVNVSATTPRMEGRPESLPSIQALPEPAALPERKWELEEDEVAALPETTLSEAAPTPTPTDPSVISDRETADAALLSTGQDEKERARLLAELERKRKSQAISEFVAGVGDAISAVASAPGGSRERMIARHATQLAEGKEDIEVKLRNDPNSDISKQYQNLVAQMMQKDPSDAAILGLTANQITEKIPAIDRMMQRRSSENLKELALKASANRSIGKDFSPAQKKFDEEMAKDMVEFTTGGGIKVAKAADASLLGTIDRFKTLFASDKIDKISGKPVLKAGKMTRYGSVAFDSLRGFYQEKYVAIEQEIRSNVTELLRSTLGAQFTEKEGERIFSQTFDPRLHPETNLRRMEALQTKLKTIADERARAVDWYKKNKTFSGYDPQSDVNWIDSEDYYSPGSWDYSKQSRRRKTKSGIDYNVSDE